MGRELLCSLHSPLSLITNNRSFAVDETAKKCVVAAGGRTLQTSPPFNNFLAKYETIRISYVQKNKKTTAHWYGNTDAAIHRCVNKTG